MGCIIFPPCTGQQMRCIQSLPCTGLQMWYILSPSCTGRQMWHILSPFCTGRQMWHILSPFCTGREMWCILSHHEDIIDVFHSSYVLLNSPNRIWIWPWEEVQTQPVCLVWFRNKVSLVNLFSCFLCGYSTGFSICIFLLLLSRPLSGAVVFYLSAATILQTRSLH